MERTTVHQMLPPVEQERLAKERIEELLKEHNLGDNVDLIYLIIRECGKSDNGDKIDLCIDKIVKEFSNQKQTSEKTDAEKLARPYSDIYTKT